MPSQTFRASASAKAAPADIWERLQVPETWEGITGVDEVFDPHFDDDELVGFNFHSTAAGRKYRGTATPGPRTAGESLRWDIATSEIKGWVEVRLEPSHPGAQVDVSMHVESVSVMAAFGFPMIAGAIAAGFEETVEEFAASLEV